MSGNLFKEIGRTSNHIIIETLNAGTINSKGVFIPATPPKVSDVCDKNWLIGRGVESTTALLPDVGGVILDNLLAGRSRSVSEIRNDIRIQRLCDCG